MSTNCCCRIFRGEAWACFLLRMWIAMRLILAGITKFLGKNEEAEWELKQENAAALMENITGTMKTQTPIPQWMLDQYAGVLPFALVGVGCWVAIGLFTRISLIAAGFIILSLTFGLLMLPEDVEGTMRGIEIIVVALALITAKHNILAVDNLIGLAIGGDRDDDDSSEEAPRRKKD